MKSRFTLALITVYTATVFYVGPTVQAKPDVISAASLTLTSTNITTNSAVINIIKDKYDYGTRTLCYDPAPTTPKSNCTTKNAVGNQGSFTITGLQSGTQYNYSIKAVDTKGGEKPYTTTGSFTTLGAVSIAPVLITPKANLLPSSDKSFNALGRTIPNLKNAPKLQLKPTQR